MSTSANKVLTQAQAWVGKKESDGSHRMIIDIYNRHRPLARNYKVKYTDAWCATFVSAVAIKTQNTDIIPTECGCGQMIELFKRLGSWIENDAYVPKAGDIIFYDWDDSGKGDNTGWPDHVGIVENVSGNIITVIEGNKNDEVGRRVISVNGKYIRGYGVPKYTASAAAPPKSPASQKVSVDPARSFNKSLAGTYQTTADLHIRAGAGTNKASLAILKKGVNVQCYGYYTTVNGTKWLYVACGSLTGFCSSNYLKK